MQLISGIKIFERPGVGPAERRCWLSQGTTRVVEMGRGSIVYERDAHVPLAPWRSPDRPELQTLWSSHTPDDPGSWVDIVPIPEAVLAPFRPIREACSSDGPISTIRDLCWSDDCVRGVAQFMEYARRFSDVDDYDFDGTGISLQPSGRSTTTVDSKSNALVGLHLDSWYGRPREERATSPNRICVNLGSSGRYFLMINLPALTLFEMLERVAPVDPLRHKVEAGLGIAFMRQFPSYPVVKLWVGPGEAYIAPTENILHDGSTEGTVGFDLTLTLRGRFRCGGRAD